LLQKHKFEIHFASQQHNLTAEMEAEQQSLKESFRNALLAYCIQRSGSSAHAEAEIAALFREHFREKNGELTLTPQALSAVIQSTPLLQNALNGAKVNPVCVCACFNPQENWLGILNIDCVAPWMH